MAHQKKEDFFVKETKPSIRAKKPVKGPTTFLDLVEEMLYLYVNIERAGIKTVHNLLQVELKIGNYRVNTKYAPRSHAGEFEWKKVFALIKSRLQDTTVQVSVKGKDGVVVGESRFGVSEALKRVPPDPPAVAQLYPLKDPKGGYRVGVLLMSFWTGTQADEAYNTALHFDAPAPISSENLLSRREYTTPRLWYLRVQVIAAQDLVINNKAQPAQIFVKASTVHCCLKTKARLTKNRDSEWKEELMFVVAEPFYEHEPLVVKVCEKLDVGDERELPGICTIPLSKVVKRNDRSPPPSLWYDLKLMEGEGTTPRFASKINMRISLDGGYHVFDEPTEFISDLRPSAKILWTPPIGIFELGIMSASGLSPVEPMTTANTFCVAKYGPKWVRTRTVIDNCSPKWNEQFHWEVYDHCTVITIAVFEDKYLHQGVPDWAIGKVRIRLSDLQLDKVYTNSHPLVKLGPYGVRKGGELQLSYRFSSTSMLNVYSRYTVPLLPKLHYKLPLSVPLIHILRRQAVALIVLKFQMANELPLSKEVVEYVLEDNNNKFSLRRARANIFRCKKLFDSFSFCKQQFDQLRNWSNPWHNLILLVCLVVVFWWPSLALSSIFFMLCGLGAWCYWKRPRQLPHMDTELSLVYSVDPDEIVEELNLVPTSLPEDQVIRMRYDRLREFILQVQTRLGDIASTVEKVQCLLSWRDRRATLVVLIFCFCVGLVFYFHVLDLRILLFCAIAWIFRGPYVRAIGLPSILENFIERMPSKVDSML